MDTTYVEALRLLRQPVPRDFQEAYDKRLHQRRAGLIENLEKLVKEETRLKGRIRAIYASIESGGFMEGGAVCLVETEDDAFVTSWNEREALRETIGSIQHHLQEAIGLGMYQGELEIEQRPGVVVRVAEYVAAMCEKYKVKLPRLGGQNEKND